MHGQLAGRDERLVVGGVLIECLELFEACVHRAGAPIERGIAFAGRLLERGWADRDARFYGKRDQAGRVSNMTISAPPVAKFGTSATAA
jgi:hypothetical protein